MKILNKQIVTFLNAIPELKKLELPIKLSYALRKNQRLFVDNYAIYEELLNEIFDKYPHKEGDEYLSEITELLNIENEIDVFMVSDSIFEKDFNISVEQLDIIDFMITKED